VPPLLLVITLSARRLPLPAAAAVTGMMLASPFAGLGGDLLLQERSFFGVHRVVLQPSGNWIMLNHGSTLHGVQARRTAESETLTALSLQPTTYYSRTGPLGDIVGLLESERRLRAVGVVGLGVGTVAAYAKPGMTLHFFEIDPTVCRIAADPRYFTYLADAAADRTITLAGFVGDGRLRLAERLPGSYDLVVIDAFASDSIPMHLLTREAVAMYAARLKPGGVIAFNVSNRYFDLAPPLGAIAASLGLHAAVRAGDGQACLGLGGGGGCRPDRQSARFPARLAADRRAGWLPGLDRRLRQPVRSVHRMVTAAAVPAPRGVMRRSIVSARRHRR
jgi:SAM-dependent methyltransferase